MNLLKCFDFCYDSPELLKSGVDIHDVDAKVAALLLLLLMMMKMMMRTKMTIKTGYEGNKHKTKNKRKPALASS